MNVILILRYSGKNIFNFYFSNIKSGWKFILNKSVESSRPVPKKLKQIFSEIPLALKENYLFGLVAVLIVHFIFYFPLFETYLSTDDIIANSNEMVTHGKTSQFLEWINSIVNLILEFLPNLFAIQIISKGIGKGIHVLLGKSLQEPLKAVLMIGVAMFLNLKLTLIYLSLAPVVIYVMSFLGKKIRKYSGRSLRSSAVMLGKLQETIAAVRVVKVYNRQKYESDIYQNLSRKLLKQALRLAKADAITMPLLDVLGMIAGSAALLLGIIWVTNGDMQASAFFGLLIFLGVAAESVRKTSDVWNQIQDWVLKASTAILGLSGKGLAT